MSTIDRTRGTRLSPAHRAAIVIGVVLGAAIALVGLPERLTLFGADIPLTVYGAPLAYPAGLVVALGTIAVVGFRAADRSWTVADLVVASVLAAHPSGVSPSRAVPGAQVFMRP